MVCALQGHSDRPPQHVPVRTAAPHPPPARSSAEMSHSWSVAGKLPHQPLRQNDAESEALVNKNLISSNLSSSQIVFFFPTHFQRGLVRRWELFSGSCRYVSLKSPQCMGDFSPGCIT